MCQKCVNLMESIYWSQMKTRAYRTHCHDITLIVSKLWPTLVETLQERNPNLCDVAGAEKVFGGLKAELENSLMIVKKCCAMRQFDKLLDHGDTKRFLTIYRDNLFLRSREVRIFSICIRVYDIYLTQSALEVSHIVTQLASNWRYSSSTNQWSKKF